MSQPGRVCGTCRFTDNTGEKWSYCRLNPPTVGINDAETHWPLVSAESDWCGKWEARSQFQINTVLEAKEPL
jgi:hypothetical protein